MSWILSFLGYRFSIQDIGLAPIFKYHMYADMKTLEMVTVNRCNYLFINPLGVVEPLNA